MKTKTHILLLLLISNIIFSQTKDESWKLYDDSIVAEIKITMSPAAFTWMMNNPQSDSLHQCTFHFKNKYIDSTVSNAGIRIRGNTSRDAQKKSFKISFNDFKKGEDFYDVQKMNLNGEHNDPSIVRSKVSWALFNQSGLPSSRASHAAVYINDTYMGIYISVENIDDEFLKKRYYDASGNLYKCLFGASLAPASGNYTQETNEDKPDLSPITRLINLLFLTTSQTLPDSLEKIMHVDEYLKYQAMNVLIGQWDDYWSNMNNYYLYHEPRTGRFHWIPYDYDNTFGIDWFSYDWAQADPYNFKKINNTKRPLIEKVMANSQYRDLYTHFLQHIIKSSFQYYMVSSIAFGAQEKIRPYALADSYRRKDYQFTDADFENSINAVPYPIPKYGPHVKKSILQFVNERNNYLKEKLTYVGSSPIIYNFDYIPKNPGPDDSIYVYASGFASAGVDRVSIQFHPGLLTVIYTYDMKFSPVPNSTVVDEADRWVGVIPPLGKNGFGRFKVEITDKNGAKVLYPRHDFVQIKTREYSTSANILINEFMADNTNTIKDPANASKDEYDDWVELYNPTSSAVLLTGMYLTDDPLNLNKWLITEPDLILNPGKHLLLWCDEQGSQPGLHTNFKLSKSGEYIALVSWDGKTIIDEFTFGEQKSDVSSGRYPDGGSNWISMKATPGAPNLASSIEDESIPVKFDLSVYPNPFNPSTKIRYSLPRLSDISVSIFNILGEEVWSFARTAVPPGHHEIKWDGRAKNNLSVASGVYICKVSAGNYMLVKKLILSK